MAVSLDPEEVDPADHIIELYETVAEEEALPQNKALRIADLLEDQLEQVNALDRTDHYAAAAMVLDAIAADSLNDAKRIINVFESRASEIASKVGYRGIKADTIRDNCLGLVRERKRELAADAAQQRRQDGEVSLSMENIGLDEYIEKHLIKVKRFTTTDAASEDSLEFVFDEPGEELRVEMDANTPTNRRDFYDVIRSATSLQVRNKMASWQLADEFDDVTEDKSDAKQEYRAVSLGPKARPWGDHPDLYEEAITNIVKEYEERIEVEGARTEAWERLVHKLESCQVTTTKDDAITHTKPLWEEEQQDLLVPTTMVDAACDGIAVDRKNLVGEMDARGVNDRFSGRKISKPQTDSDGNAMRFWFFDANHEEVPEPDPDQLVDNLGGGLDNLPEDPVGQGAPDSVAIDGGVTGGKSSVDGAETDDTEESEWDGE